MLTLAQQGKAAREDEVSTVVSSVVETDNSGDEEREAAQERSHGGSDETSSDDDDDGTASTESPLMIMALDHHRRARQASSSNWSNVISGVPSSVALHRAQDLHNETVGKRLISHQTTSSEKAKEPIDYSKGISLQHSVTHNDAVITRRSNPLLGSTSSNPDNVNHSHADDDTAFGNAAGSCATATPPEVQTPRSCVLPAQPPYTPQRVAMASPATYPPLPYASQINKASFKQLKVGKEAASDKLISHAPLKCILENINPNKTHQILSTERLAAAPPRAVKELDENVTTAFSTAGGGGEDGGLAGDESMPHESFEVIEEDFKALHRQDWGSVRPDLLRDLDFISRLPAGPVLNYESLGASLPPLEHPSGCTLFLDLDETLSHTEVIEEDELREGGGQQPLGKKRLLKRVPDLTFTSTGVEDGSIATAHVYFRPWISDFLRMLSHHYEIVCYTASLKPYADTILTALDPEGCIHQKLYREQCTQYGNTDIFFKDLHGTGRRLEKCVILDNRLISFGLNVDNGILLPSYMGASLDTDLLSLLPFLTALSKEEDLRVPLRQRYRLSETMASYAASDWKKSLDSFLGDPTFEGDVFEAVRAAAAAAAAASSAAAAANGRRRPPSQRHQSPGDQNAARAHHEAAPKSQRHNKRTGCHSHSRGAMLQLGDDERAVGAPLARPDEECSLSTSSTSFSTDEGMFQLSVSRRRKPSKRSPGSAPLRPFALDERPCTAEHTLGVAHTCSGPASIYDECDDPDHRRRWRRRRPGSIAEMRLRNLQDAGSACVCGGGQAVAMGARCLHRHRRKHSRHCSSSTCRRACARDQYLPEKQAPDREGVPHQLLPPLKKTAAAVVVEDVTAENYTSPADQSDGHSTSSGLSADRQMDASASTKQYSSDNNNNIDHASNIYNNDNSHTNNTASTSCSDHMPVSPSGRIRGRDSLRSPHAHKGGTLGLSCDTDRCVDCGRHYGSSGINAATNYNNITHHNCNTERRRRQLQIRGRRALRELDLCSEPHRHDRTLPSEGSETPLKPPSETPYATSGPSQLCTFGGKLHQRPLVPPIWTRPSGPNFVPKVEGVNPPWSLRLGGETTGANGDSSSSFKRAPHQSRAAVASSLFETCRSPNAMSISAGNNGHNESSNVNNQSDQSRPSRHHSHCGDEKRLDIGSTATNAAAIPTCNNSNVTYINNSDNIHKNNDNCSPSTKPHPSNAAPSLPISYSQSRGSPHHNSSSRTTSPASIPTLTTNQLRLPAETTSSSSALLHQRSGSPPASVRQHQHHLQHMPRELSPVQRSCVNYTSVGCSPTRNRCPPSASWGQQQRPNSPLLVHRYPHFTTAGPSSPTSAVISESSQSATPFSPTHSAAGAAWNYTPVSRLYIPPASPLFGHPSGANGSATARGFASQHADHLRLSAAAAAGARVPQGIPALGRAATGMSRASFSQRNLAPLGSDLAAAAAGYSLAATSVSNASPSGANKWPQSPGGGFSGGVNVMHSLTSVVGERVPSGEGKRVSSEDRFTLYFGNNNSGHENTILAGGGQLVEFSSYQNCGSSSFYYSPPASHSAIPTSGHIRGGGSGTTTTTQCHFRSLSPLHLPPTSVGGSRHWQTNRGITAIQCGPSAVNRARSPTSH